MKIVANTTQASLLAFIDREGEKEAKGRILLRLDTANNRIIAVEEASLSFFEHIWLAFDTRYRLDTIARHLLSELEANALLPAPGLTLVDKKIYKHNNGWFKARIEESNKVLSLSSRILHPVTASTIAHDLAQSQYLLDYIMLSRREEDVELGKQVLARLSDEPSNRELDLCRSILSEAKPLQASIPARKIDVRDLYVVDANGVIEQKGDGNCLLTSFAAGLRWLDGSLDFTHEALRSQAMEYIEKHLMMDDLLAGYVETAKSEFNDDMRLHTGELVSTIESIRDDKFDFTDMLEKYDNALQTITSAADYIQRAKQNHFWCSTPQIYALSKCFHVSIEIYLEGKLKQAPYCIMAPEATSRGTVCLTYTGGHYNTYIKDVA